MNYRSSIYLPLILLTIVSCDKGIIGEWKLDDYTYDIKLPIKYILIEEDKSIVIDENSLIYSFDYQVLKNRLILANEFQKIEFELEKLSKDSIRLDSLKLLPITKPEKGKIYTINLIERETNKFITFRSDIRQYRISAQLNSEKDLILKLGGRISKVEDIPIYLTCYHCNQIKETILFLDKEVTFEKLREIYYWLKLSNNWKVGLVTRSNVIDKHEGFYDNIEIWEEEANKFKKLENLPPLPPLYLRAEYLKSLENVKQLEVTNEKDLEEVSNFIKAGKEDLLINFDQISSIAEYVELKLNLMKLISDFTEIKSREEFKKGYEELTIEQKRRLGNELPTIKFEMRLPK